MSSSSFFNIEIIDVNPEFNLFFSHVPMANLNCAFFICWQEYSTEGVPLDEETTTGVEFREGSLTPLGSSFIPAILQDPLVISNIQDDPRIGALKLVNPGYIKRPFFSGVLNQNGSFVAQCSTYLEPCIPAGTHHDKHTIIPSESCWYLLWFNDKGDRWPP
ncbi:hypothetical protein PENARI_c104G02748 [Penicillium arizonense]|uniref:Uncharacterized protein n=1 Tax=Penicillium arizonense TaxID=1835702 RepID=A0A1F5L1L7_PENAI|nr:hypothetical protein PENARI_c104G02748 [Penicillium arizonense]OGE46821.1 hypothetical protein PENARI_c104G02748 [Penicillium arizonense]